MKATKIMPGIELRYAGKTPRYFIRVMVAGRRVSATYATLEEAMDAVVQLKTSKMATVIEKLKKDCMTEDDVTFKIRAGTKMLSKQEAFRELKHFAPHELDADKPKDVILADGEIMHIPAKFVEAYINLAMLDPHKLQRIIDTDNYIDIQVDI
jgi:hypothetical protein